MTSYSINELDDAIYSYLLQNINNYISEYNIYNKLIELKICPDLDNKEKKEIYKLEFQSICRILNHIFNNVHKEYYNNTLYLAVSETEEFEFDEELYNNSESDDVAEDDLVNYYDLVKSIYSKNKNNISEIHKCSIYDYIDEFNTPLHIAVQNNDIDLVDNMLRMQPCDNIDLQILNENGKSALDISLENDNAKITKLLLDTYYHNKLLKCKIKYSTVEEKHIYNMNKLKNELYNYNLITTCGICLSYFSGMMYLNYN
jgi:hypothetical protein